MDFDITSFSPDAGKSGTRPILIIIVSENLVTLPFKDLIFLFVWFSSDVAFIMVDDTSRIKIKFLIVPMFLTLWKKLWRILDEECILVGVLFVFVA